jgi:hypothetical protein
MFIGTEPDLPMTVGKRGDDNNVAICDEIYHAQDQPVRLIYPLVGAHKLRVSRIGHLPVRLPNGPLDPLPIKVAF